MTETIYNIKITEEQRNILLESLDAIDYENQPESPSNKYMGYFSLLLALSGLFTIIYSSIALEGIEKATGLFGAVLLYILAYIGRKSW